MYQIVCIKMTIFLLLTKKYRDDIWIFGWLNKKKIIKTMKKDYLKNNSSFLFFNFKLETFYIPKQLKIPPEI